MHVRDLMTEKVICCTPWVTAQAAANLMKNQRVGAIPVVKELCESRCALALLLLERAFQLRCEQNANTVT